MAKKRPQPQKQQHLANLRRKDLLPQLSNDRATCLLCQLFRLGLRRFCYYALNFPGSAKPRWPRTPRPEPEAPPWLAALRQGLFTADFPQVDPHYQAMDGSQVVCERRVEEQGPRLLYREIWRHPLTLEPVHTWWQELDVSSLGLQALSAENFR